MARYDQIKDKHEFHLSQGNAMHSLELLHNYLKKSCPEIHKRHLGHLMRALQSLLNQGKLTLTSLG